MQTVQETVLRAIESLRRLMVDLYPPDLSVSQLPSALSDLADPLRHNGIVVKLAVEPLPEMDIDVVTTIYRVAHEAWPTSPNMHRPRTSASGWRPTTSAGTANRRTPRPLS